MVSEAGRHRLSSPVLRDTLLYPRRGGGGAVTMSGRGLDTERKKVGLPPSTPFTGHLPATESDEEELEDLEEISGLTHDTELPELDEPMPDSGTGETPADTGGKSESAEPPPYAPSEEILALAKGDGPLVARLRALAERSLADLTATERAALPSMLLADHVVTAELVNELRGRVRKLTVAYNKVGSDCHHLKQELEVVRRLRSDHELDERDGTTPDRVRIARLESQLEKIAGKGTLPMVIEAPVAPIAPVTNNIQGLLGRVNEFSSEKESKMSFAAWAQIFEENAELRGIPEESWTPLAKTNLAGKARERWLQAEAALPPGTSSTWQIFKEKLTPLFAEADKRASAKRAYGRLEQNGCRDSSADALREYGRQFLGAYNEMGPERTVTEKGAIEAYIRGLPEPAHTVAILTLATYPGQYDTLDGAVRTTTNLTATYAAKEASLPQGMQLGNKGKRRLDIQARGAESSTQHPRPNKRPRGGHGGFAKDQHGQGKHKSEVALLADWSIRAHVDNDDPRPYSRDLADILKSQSKCLGCRRPGHLLQNCRDTKVPAHVKSKYANGKEPKN